MVIAGCDSPGSSAKYCTYSFIDTDTDRIIHSVTVGKRQVQLKSPNMENRAFVLGLDYLMQIGINVVEVVTDGSTFHKEHIVYVTM